MRHALRGAPVAIVAAVLLAILAAPAAASGSLAVNTGAATEITAKAATLHGTVTVKEGEGALTGFEYGTTTEYGETVTAQPVGPGTHDVHAQIEGLQPETTYHYRAAALNEDGITYGEDRTFTTIEHFAPRFDAEEHPVEIAGEQGKQLVLTAAGGTVTCNQLALSSGAASPTSQLELDAAYSGCTGWGLSASVAMNSCRYVLSALNAGPPYVGELDIVCAEEGESIKVLAGAGSCKMEIGPQQGLGSIELENVGSGKQRQIEADLDISGISYTMTSGFFCPAAGGSNDNGTLTGSIALAGFNEAEDQVGLYLSGEETDEVGLFLSGEQSEEEAQQPRFDAEEHPVEIAGEQGKQLVLTAAGGTVTCNQLALSSGAASPTSQLELDAAYSGCTGWGLSASVAMNSCRYVLSALNAGPPYVGELDIVCAEEGDAIEVLAGAGSCKMEIGPQQGLGSIELENVGSGKQRQIEADLDISGISYTMTSGFFCPATGGSNNNGTLTGSIELSGSRGEA